MKYVYLLVVSSKGFFNFTHNLFIPKEPAKPVIKVPESGKDIPIGDGSPVTMNVGDNVTAASNTTITIRCPVSGVPTPAVTWERDGVQVIKGVKLSIKDDNTLTIRGANLEDSAKYTCTVQNAFGKVEASSIAKMIGKCSFVASFRSGRQIEIHVRRTIKTFSRAYGFFSQIVDLRAMMCSVELSNVKTAASTLITSSNKNFHNLSHQCRKCLF